MALGGVRGQHVRHVASRSSAYALIAIIVLHAGPPQVAALAATGRAVGAVMAVPLGPWVEFRRKRPVMIAMDLVRFAAVMSVPAAFALGWLSFAQLLIVSVIVAAADIAFRAASGAYLKVACAAGETAGCERTVRVHDLDGDLARLLRSEGRRSSIFGPVTTVVVDAISYLLSRDRDPSDRRRRAGALFAPMPCGSDSATCSKGGGYILAHPTLRPLFLNTTLVNGLIMATSPLVAVLMLGQLGFKPWQYGLAFGAPCVGGLIGSRLARPLVARFGQHPVMLGAGVLRACWSIGLAFIHPGIAGIVLIIAVQFGLVTCMGRVQSRARDLSARKYRQRPDLPHAVGVVGHQ